ncbi:23S rRNA (adenine(1618)-N(6))-methyltransferase RlmF [Vibrio sagamiensis]|uniref:Ribosomal RNA large subunit methyltransferase F n=1 Tax=Vibrio sagamiensis NBRC 104589 TaxID=1219064 RepID=A0A511QDI8_9VIBR|nr:23S rRNA (adenine(1618)-N(6))-methyltransferase RlmF [Vibrio sagamiensis]PNQ65376.1 23S rRNA (adenine(1618)-N(6))-methyltransferase RlmF [Vibrio agarivorans]GEM75374.1 ribosomal RNA large subunit methyltransferase F [Vibrio sagamiensis NBRC 104589]
MTKNNQNLSHSRSNQPRSEHGKINTKNKAKRNKPQSTRKALVSEVNKEIDFIKVTKSGLHPRNAHHGRYDFKKLLHNEPQLQAFMVKNPNGEDTINFSDAQAVKVLNRALLKTFYDLQYWDIPEYYLCPPIPGRADYIHRIAELLDNEVKGHYPHKRVRALDIGVGANCIYPIVGVTQYAWHYIGSDVDPTSIKSAQKIISANDALRSKIEVIQQTADSKIYHGIIQPNQYFDVTTCNPPFHRSAEEAAAGTARKRENLKLNQQKKKPTNGKNTFQHSNSAKQAKLNFGGQKTELWCKGGEEAFIRKMALESQDFRTQVLWFTTLISKKDNVRPMRKQLEKLGVKAIRVIEMSQGQKVSRLMAWSYMSAKERKQWIALNRTS